MSMYDKTHFNIVISLQLIKINGKKKKSNNALLSNLWIKGGNLKGNKKYIEQNEN